jgi:hypothetical protein
MKKLILPFALVTLCMSGTSCKKCQSCTTTTHQTVSGYTQTSNSTQDYCGDDYDDAPAEGTTTQSSGGVDQQVIIDCEPG